MNNIWYNLLKIKIITNYSSRIKYLKILVKAAIPDFVFAQIGTWFHKTLPAVISRARRQQ